MYKCQSGCLLASKIGHTFNWLRREVVIHNGLDTKVSKLRLQMLHDLGLVLEKNSAGEVRISLSEGTSLGARAATDIHEQDGRAGRALREASLEVQGIETDGSPFPLDFHMRLRKVQCPRALVQPFVGRLVCTYGAGPRCRPEAERVVILVRFEPNRKIECS